MGVVEELDQRMRRRLERLRRRPRGGERPRRPEEEAAVEAGESVAARAVPRGESPSVEQISL